MNFLGHAFLSGNNTDLLYGNFIADAVKGNHYEQYSQGVQMGIKLHRQIDYFIDHYPGFDDFKKGLYPLAGKMTPVVVDMFSDHVLATHWNEFHEKSLEDFAAWFYATVEHYQPFPKKVAMFYPHMKTHNWLFQYQRQEGFSWALVNVAKRIRFPMEMEAAVAYCLEEKTNFLPKFYPFIEKISNHAKSFLNNYPPL